MSGYAIIKYMDLWDGEHICAQLRYVVLQTLFHCIMCIDFFFGKKYSRLHTIKLQDSGTLRRWFLIDLLKHRMNECVDNIPYELRFLVRQTCGASNEKYC
jgi:hypothetical protein